MVDAFIVALGIRRSPEVAWQMFWVHAEATGLAAVTYWLIWRFSGRERPWGLECESDPDYVSDCEAEGRYQSFFSGHTAMSVLGAGLICADHQSLPLYGGGWGDRVACFAGIGGATIVAASRILADKHFITDVIVGAAIGFAAGYLWPMLVRYRGEAEDDAPAGDRRSPPAAVDAAIVPWATDSAIGAGLVGTIL